MKLLIIGAHPGGNKGAEAMLEVLVSQIHNKSKSTEFIFETLSGKEDYSHFEKEGIKFSKNMFQVKNLFKPYKENIKGVDYIIDIGGLSYTDKSIRNNLRSFLKHFGLIIRGNKLIFFTQDFGPSNKITTRLLGGLVTKLSHKVFTRSTISRDILLKKFGVDSNKVEGPFPDSTLLYKDTTVENITKEKDYVIVSPSAILYNTHGEKYIELLSKIIQHVSQDNRVFILVHCFTKNGNTSDLEVAKKLISINKNTQLIADDISPKYLKRIISDAKFVMTSRYHVLVGAMSTNVPAIAIGWNEKYKSYLDLYNMGHMSIKFNKDILSNVIRMINENLSDDEIKNSLNKTNIKLIKETEISFSTLMKSLGL